MNNLKTAFIVVLLLGALYGAYQFLNQRDVPPPAEAQLQFDQGIVPPTIEFGSGDGDFAAQSTGVPEPLPGAFPTTSGEPPVSPTLETPSFAVMPSTQPRFDELPANATAPPTRVAETTNDGAVRPAEHSAYAEAAPRVATREASSTPTREELPNLQSNPWYRPDRQPASVPAGASLSPEAAQRASRAAFQLAWTAARELVERGKFAAALAELTAFYDSGALTTVEQQQLQKTLDSLAGRVIYSTEHYLAEPHVVRADETLMDVAAKYNVQWQLLQNINGIRDPHVLVPKTQLKVMRGPFRAEVNLQTSYLTLFVDKYYAGRFVVGIGRDPLPPPGSYAVRDKREGKDYFPANGRAIAAGHPSNPYGQHWIDLGSEICLHGSAQRDVSPDYGCISLTPIDAADVFGILTLGANVTVRR